MSWFRQLERRLEPLAIPNLTLYIVIGQTFVLLTSLMGLVDANKLVLWPALVQHGEYWRVLTYAFIPILSGGRLGLVFIAFTLYLFYLYGSALEHFWGALRFNLFVLLGWALNTAAAFIVPHAPADNYYWFTSLFLAFSFLNPEFELYIFFILPVKIKWLALFMWLQYAYSFARGELAERLAIGAATITFLLFFGTSIRSSIVTGRRRMQQQSRRVAEQAADDREPRHRCHVCGKTDLTNPEMDFRYCSKCAGDQCYCPEHIRNHVHVTETEPAKR